MSDGLAAQRRRYDPSLGGDPHRFGFRLPATYSIARDALFARAPQDTAAYEERDGATVTVTFGEIQDRASRTASVLASLGVGKADRVAVFLPPSVRTATVIFGALRLGATVMTAPMLLGSEALAYRVGHSGAKVLVTDQSTVDILDDTGVLDDLTVVTVDDGPGHHLDDLLAHAQPSIAVDLKPDDAALLMYTSGTSGHPKGVLHGQRFLLGHVGVDCAAEGFRPGDTFYGTADWGWIGGLMLGLLVPWAHGIPTVTWRPDRFDPERIVRMWDQIGVTTAFVPPAAIRMFDEANVRPRRLLRSLITGGELPTQTDLAIARARLSEVTNNAYGQTEANALIGNSRMLGRSSDDTLGRPYPGHRITVRDESGATVTDGEPGEICLELPDPVALLRYWDDPEATAEAIGGGYLRTNDAGAVTETGAIRYLGRTDDVIKTSGYRIGPAEVERVISQHDAVAEVVVIGQPDEVRGQRIRAALRLRPGSTPSEQLFTELRELARQGVGAHAVPAYFDIVRDFPRTSTGKVERKALAKEMQS
jgi:acetyl-CoA synthetase